MNDAQISQICIIITIIGIVAFILFYTEEFKEKTIQELLQSEEKTKGIIFGKVEYVIRNSPTTNIVITDGTSATLYFGKETNLKKNDFITAYVEKEKENHFYAYKVIKET